jgi:predicted NUDIX family NTP pyrophosphohydrolase
MVMAVTSAGILLYRRTVDNTSLEVLLIHPGGPFWAGKDLGAWSIPKGGIEPGEDGMAAARREFTEELGLAVPLGVMWELGEVRLKSGKRIQAWALAGDVDVSQIVSLMTEVTLRGRTFSVPEVDRAEWFGLEEARVKLNAGQVPLVDRLVELLTGG